MMMLLCKCNVRPHNNKRETVLINAAYNTQDKKKLHRIYQTIIDKTRAILSDQQVQRDTLFSPLLICDVQYEKIRSKKKRK